MLGRPMPRAALVTTASLSCTRNRRRSPATGYAFGQTARFPEHQGEAKRTFGDFLNDCQRAVY